MEINKKEITFQSLSKLFPENNDRYFACSDGTIWSNRNGVMKQLKPYDAGCGYYKVDLYIGGKVHKCRVNRLIAFAFTDNEDALEHPHLYVSHHINHVRKDNRVENLELLKFWEHFDRHRIERDKNKSAEEKFQLGIDENGGAELLA